MFRKGLCLRSPVGLGQVAVDGDPPLVRFLDGRECHVAEESLTIVPTEDFEAEIANQTVWNRFLTLCVRGRHGLDDCEPLWVRDEDGIWASPGGQRREPKRWSGPVEHFLPDDLGQDARVVTPDEVSDERDVIELNYTWNKAFEPKQRSAMFVANVNVVGSNPITRFCESVTNSGASRCFFLRRCADLTPQAGHTNNPPEPLTDTRAAYPQISPPALIQTASSG